MMKAIVNKEKLCISCGSGLRVNYSGPKCRSCYIKENPVSKEKTRQYRQKILSTITHQFNAAKGEAKERKIVWNMTKEEYSVFRSQPCFYCGGSLPISGAGLDRISNDRSVGYKKENVVPCCATCSSIRGDKLTVAETITAIHAIKEHRMSAIGQFHEENYHVDSRTVCIFGEINEKLSLQVQKAFDILEAISKHAEITIKIMSNGGNWFDGLAIYDRIASSPCPTRMIGTGLVGSTATAIFQAGKLREITENCVFVLHDGTEGFEGEAKSFEAWGETSKKSRQLLYEIYSKATGKPTSFWQSMCLKDTVLWQKDILSYGLADKVLGEE